jgi:hypothetical protein
MLKYSCFNPSTMSIVDQQLVDIEIFTSSGEVESQLRLNYQGQVYHLRQAFAVPKLAALAAKLFERVNQQLRQLTTQNGDRYLLVRETSYYSLWELDRSELENALIGMGFVDRQISLGLELQQASIWLFQELWSQLAESIGERQLHALADNLVAVTPQVQSGLDLDRLLTLDPLKTDKLNAWAEVDFATFDRQLYHLTQRKIGQKFGTELTLDIIQTMPERLQLVLKPVLDL